MAHVTIIDDSRLIRELLSQALKREGFAVSAAAGADAGLELVRRDRPGVVLLDLEMPGRDGVAFLRELRADRACARTPVVMLSGSPARDIVLRLAQIGVQGIILKSEHMMPEIVRRVRDLIGKPEPEPISSPAGATDPGASSAPRGIVDPAPARPSSPEPTTVTLAHSAPIRVETPARPAVFEKPPADAPAARGAHGPRPRPEPGSPEDDESMRISILQLEGESADIEQATQELKKLKPLITRSELIERVVEGVDLRAIKPAVQQVLTLTGSAASSIETIAKAIKHDQALALKVLKVANSPIYTRGERVETVQKAVARIGVAQIRTTVLSLSVIDSFGSAGALGGRIKGDWFWEHSIACGLLAARIARVRALKSEAIDALFTAGLLHDVGRVIYAERLGDEYAAVIDAADRLGMPLETVESRLLLVNHADLTDRLLRCWNFSPELVNPIALHHLSVGNIRRTAPRMAESVATLGLANRLAHALLLGSSGNEVLYPIEEFVHFLGLSADQVRDLCETVPEQTLDTKLQMLSHGGASATTVLDDARARLGSHIRPLHVKLQGHANAASILFDRLSPGAATDPPNLAIVRVNHIRERAQLVSMLRAAEQECGLKNLPALVLGAGQGCFFAEGMLGERTVEQTVLPLRLSRLFRSVNTLVAPGAPAVAA